MELKTWTYNYWLKKRYEYEVSELIEQDFQKDLKVYLSKKEEDDSFEGGSKEKKARQYQYEGGEGAALPYSLTSSDEYDPEDDEEEVQPEEVQDEGVIEDEQVEEVYGEQKQEVDAPLEEARIYDDIKEVIGADD